ncbi:MAG: hypothetical protein JXR70_08715 [Spirochaetales bacterium]|nr:hypothetical protein [Spirochaetales bacterium]
MNNGRLWIKEPTAEKPQWIGLGTIEHPFNTTFGSYYISHIEELSVDGPYIILRANNKLYWSLDGEKNINNIVWFDRWGFPFSMGSGMAFPDKNIKWTATISHPDFNKYYVDQNSIKFYCFVGGVYYLDSNQTDLHMTDGWLPRDWEYQFGGPVRGRFKALNISASGSSVFLINQFGDMFTRHVDFDNNGANPFFTYTYDNYKVDDYNKIYDLEIPRRLPHEDWVMQNKIPGELTSKITVISTGPGQINRKLRVQGRLSGNTGYFEKMIGDTNWNFVQTDEYITESDFISNNPADMSESDLGPSKEYIYKGILSNAVAITIDEFNFYSSPAKITFTSGSDSLQIPLHHNPYYRVFAQEGLGNVTPMRLNGAIKLPQTGVEQKFLKPLVDLYQQLKEPAQDKYHFPVKIIVDQNTLTISNNNYPFFNVTTKRSE